MNLLSLARFVLSAHWAATVALLLSLAAPAMAQWKTNPVVEDPWLYQGDLPATDRCRLGLDGCALVIRPGCGDLAIERTNRKGVRQPAKYFSDPTYPYIANGGKYCVNTYHSVVGCKISQFDFMVAYRIDLLGGPFGSVLRVARLHWDDQADTYNTVAGFPVTIGNLPALGMSITPNETGTSIDGALISWQVQTTAPDQVWIYQQGVTGLGGQQWAPALTGLVVDSYFGTLSSATQPTSVVSTGDRMAVTTYHRMVAGNLLHWTAKMPWNGSLDSFAPMQVPGQANTSPSRCCVASDGGVGAFYGFATDASITSLVVAQIPVTSIVPPVTFWNSTQGLLGVPIGTEQRLRALTLLAMPGQKALLVYRDRDGIRCIQWGNGLSYLWTRYVRGATLVNNDDDADAVRNAGTVCVVTTSDADVRAKAFSDSGVESWDTLVNDDTAVNPYISTHPYGPHWPHVWATGGSFTPGFMLGWCDTDGQIEAQDEGPEYFLAERITMKGKVGKAFGTGYSGGGYQLGGAMLFDLQSFDPLRLQKFELELGESIGSGGLVEIYTAVGTSYVGIENNAAAWTLAGSGNILSAGTGQLSSVLLAAPIVLPAGTNGLLIRGVGVSLGSTAAAGSNLTFNLGDLTVQCGAQVANWPSGAVQTARVFHGSFAYEDAGIPVVAAAHIVHGLGCYAQSDSFYSYFPNAGAAAVALTGQSMRMIPTGGDQYLVTWGGGTYVAPSGGATPLFFAPNHDDGIAVFALPAPIALPGGVVTSLIVHSNGSVWAGDNLPTLLPNDYTPRRVGMLASPYTGFWSWHDHNPSEPGSGQVLLEVGFAGEIYITWQDVESYPLGVVNRSTIQFQMDATGAVTWVWPSLSANSASPFGSGYLVGYSPGGASTDGGSLNLSTALPLQTTVGMLPLSLTASPAPIPGTTVTYTTSNMPEAAPGSGIYVGVLILSLSSSPGIDLGFLGAPGCLLHVGSLDVMQTMVGVSPTQSMSFTIPAGAPLGTLLHAQSAALFVPGSLPNGQNAFGLTTSNGILSRIGN